MKRSMILVGLIVLSLVAFVKMMPAEAAPIPGNCDYLGCTHRFVEAPNGVELAVKEFGDPNGPVCSFTDFRRAI